MSLSRVSIARVDKAIPASVDEALELIFDRQGGLSNYIQHGHRVLLKPDLMLDYPGGTLGTTSPDIVAGVGRLVKKCGGKVLIGDSPFALRHGIEEVWVRTGMVEAAEREGFELVSFEKAGSRPVALDTRVYYISRAALDADIVINLPVLKADSRTRFAGALRNLVGVVPGFQKGRYYKKASSSRELARFLVDMLAIVRPAITVIEAPAGACKESRCGGHSGFLLASSDSVAIDSVLSHLLAVEHGSVEPTRMAAEAGLGMGWPELIEVEGVPLDVLRRQLSAQGRRKLWAVFDYLTRCFVEPYVWMRSTVDHQRCEGCGSCVDRCPTSALRFSLNSRIPHINQALCINCFAGISVCPSNAISLVESRLAGKIFSPSVA